MWWKTEAQATAFHKAHPGAILCDPALTDQTAWFPIFPCKLQLIHPHQCLRIGDKWLSSALLIPSVGFLPVSPTIIQGFISVVCPWF